MFHVLHLIIVHTHNKPILTCLLVSGRLIYWHEINTDQDWEFWYEILRINIRWYWDLVIEEIDHYNLRNYSRIFYWIMDIWSWPIYLDLWITWHWHHMRYFAFVRYHLHYFAFVIGIATVYIVSWSWYTLYSLSDIDIHDTVFGSYTLSHTLFCICID